jgi:FAD:protein FMN transferase
MSGTHASCGTVRVARTAMATRFEVVLHGARPESLRAAAEEALDEIEAVESWLSPYRTESELARLHRLGVARPLRVDPRLLRFLLLAQEYSRRTQGLFDPTLGPLVRAWGFQGGIPVSPDDSAIAIARTRVGWNQFEIDEAAGTVQLACPGVEFHPGAMGKGYALDRAVEILRDAGIEHALIHGGTSTVCALGSPPDADGWEISLPIPPAGSARVWPGGTPPRITLRDTTLSVSAVWGRPEARVHHILDPRTGEPANGLSLAAVAADSATDSDVWSTALLVGGPQVMAGQTWARFWCLEGG